MRGDIELMILKAAAQGAGPTYGELYQSIKSISAERKYSYHYIYQVIRKLLSKGKLSAKDGRLSISPGWVRQVSEVKNEYLKNPLSPDFLDLFEVCESAVFSSFREVERFQKFMDLNVMPVLKDKMVIWDANTYWYLLLYPKEEIDLFTYYKKLRMETHLIVRGDSPLNRYVSRFYSRLGVKTKVVKETASWPYRTVQGGVLFQFAFPDEFVRAVNDIYKGFTSIEDLDLVKIGKIISGRLKIGMVVVKDKTVVDHYVQEILRLFK